MNIYKLLSDKSLLRLFFIAHAMLDKHFDTAEYHAVYEELRARGYDMCEVIDVARFLTAFGNEEDRKIFAKNWEETALDVRF